MEWLVLGLASFAFLCGLIIIGVPVAFSLSFVSIVVMLLMGGLDSLMTVATSAYSTNASFLLLAIPLFIFMGECVAVSGVGKDAFKMLDTWFYWLPGRPKYCCRW